MLTSLEKNSRARESLWLHTPTAKKVTGMFYLAFVCLSVGNIA